MGEKSTKRIGLLVDSIEDLCESEICQGVLSYFSKLDVQVIIFEGVHNFRKAGAEDQYISFFEMINDSNLDGLILFSIFFMDHLSVQQLDKFIHAFSGIPVVSLGCSANEIPSVIINEKKGLHRLVEFVVSELELSNISLMFGSIDNIQSEQRLSAVLHSLNEYGISIKKRNILRLEDMSHDAVQQETLNLISNTLVMPEAIICYDDYIAHAVLECLNNKGIQVPGEIIVTGFDDIPLNSRLHSKLLTVKQPFISMGKEAASILSRMIEQIPVEIKTYIDPYLIISTEVKISKTNNFSSHLPAESLSVDDELDIAVREVNRIIHSLAGESDISGKILLDIYFTANIHAIFYEPLKLKQRFKNYFSEIHHNAEQLRELLELLQCCLDKSYRICYRSYLPFSLFSFSLNCVSEMIQQVLTIEKYTSEEISWNSTLGGQILLRSDSLSELCSKMPLFLDTYKINRCFLFLYQRDYHYHNSQRKELPVKTELIYVRSQPDDEPVDYPMTFKTMKVLPHWNILNCQSDFIFIMLFYNNLPVGHVFLDYDPRINPLQYGALRINLETALYNLLQIEESQNRLNDQSRYYINRFQELKDPITQAVLKFGRVKERSVECSEIRDLQLAMSLLSSKVNSLFPIEEELHSFNFDEELNLSLWLKREYGRYSEIDNQNIHIKFDSVALDLIFQIIESDSSLWIEKVQLTEDNGIVLNIIIGGYALSEADLKRIYSQEFISEKICSDLPTVPYSFSSIKQILDRGKIPVTFTGDPDNNSTSTSILFTRLQVDRIKRVPIKVSQKEIMTGEKSSQSSILLVEPTRALRKAIAAEISRDFFVIQCSSVSEYMSQKEDQKHTFVVADIPSVADPTWSYFEEFCSQQMSRGIPFIITSGRKSAKERYRAMEMGAVDFLEKPYSIDMLKGKLINSLQIMEVQKNRFIQDFNNTIVQMAAEKKPLTDIRSMLIGESLKNNFGLTGRELEITLLMEKKLIHRQIADKMNLTEQTIRNMSHTIYKKCQVSGKKELIELIRQFQL